MKNIKNLILLLFLPIVLMAAQENFFAKFGVNIRAYFNTFYNAKVYFNDAQDAYDNEEDKDNLSPTTRTALNKAAMQAETVINKFPNSSYVDDAMFYNSVCQFQLRRFERALQKLEELTLEHPGSPYYFEAKLWISKCYFEMDKKTLAYDLLDQFLENSNNRDYFTDAYSLMGYLALQENDRERALNSFLQAADKANDKAPRCDMYMEAVEILIDEERYEEALKYTDRAGRNVKFDEQRARVQIAYVRIHRLMGETDKANEYIDEGLKDARLAQYWGDILYEQSNIFFADERDLDAVNTLRYIVSDPEKIYQKNRDSKAWAKAAYRLGHYYLYEANMIDSSDFYFKKALTKRRQCEEGELADKYLNDLKQMKKINKELAAISKGTPALRDSAWAHYEYLADSTAIEMMDRMSLLSDTLTVDSIAVDSIKDLANGQYRRFEKALNNYLDKSDNYVSQLFSLAGLFLFDLDYPDTALSIYEKIQNEYYYTSSIPQAMYSQAYVWEHELGKKFRADSIKNEITGQFPGSEISYYILDRVPDDSLLYYGNQEKIFDIEKKYIDTGKFAEAVDELKKLLRTEELDKKNHAFTAYKIAWLYDYELSLGQNTQDSTLYYYHLVNKKHPGTPLATQSSHRIAEIETDINDYLAYMAGDSLKSKDVDIDSTLLAAKDDTEGDFDRRTPHPIFKRLRSPGRPRPIRL